ncbi:phage tail terminator protein [Entomohabitans teleogrylli]|uniref:phage tail terminator protein n=1 Tax=Entomohabitans teleogrylli TaxID=1384589 RepID=UPI00073D79D4|nr:phage tail terminator protein [Entomohabitans teleogrylli]
MINHAQIRAAVLAALQSAIQDNLTWHDGYPGVINATGLPAIAVYLTEAKYTGDELDGNTWSAELRIGYFSAAENSDNDLDIFIGEKVYPLIEEGIPQLADKLESMVLAGCDYLRDEETMLWRAAVLKYNLIYNL